VGGVRLGFVGKQGVHGMPYLVNQRKKLKGQVPAPIRFRQLREMKSPAPSGTGSTFWFNLPLFMVSQEPLRKL